jgi:hypothetical protein
MGTTTELRQEVKSRFVPFMAERGFMLDMRDAPTFFLFRKVTPEQIYFCDIQWEKYGRPRFRVSFGCCEPNGGFTHNNQPIPPDRMMANWCKIYGSSHKPDWFRQDRPWWQFLYTSQKLYPANLLVDNVMMWFSEVESYFETGAVGSHIKIWKS